MNFGTCPWAYIYTQTSHYKSDFHVCMDTDRPELSVLTHVWCIPLIPLRLLGTQECIAGPTPRKPSGSRQEQQLCVLPGTENPFLEKVFSLMSRADYDVESVFNIWFA
ncbi:hypothetical protein ILYODFUR_030508, partial [Ilyodon furcidens]